MKYKIKPNKDICDQPSIKEIESNSRRDNCPHCHGMGIVKEKSFGKYNSVTCPLCEGFGILKIKMASAK